MAAQSLHGMLLEAAQAALQGLDLVDIPDNHIVIHGIPTDKDKWFPGVPGIVVSPFGTETIIPSEGDNLRDDIQYPVWIIMVDAANQDQSFDLMDKRLLWRETALDHFIHNTLTIPTANRIYDQTIEPAPIVSLDAWQANLWQSSFMVRCKCMVPRRA